MCLKFWRTCLKNWRTSLKKWRTRLKFWRTSLIYGGQNEFKNGGHRKCLRSEKIGGRQKVGGLGRKEVGDKRFFPSSFGVNFELGRIYDENSSTIRVYVDLRLRVVLYVTFKKYFGYSKNSFGRSKPNFLYGIRFVVNGKSDYRYFCQHRSD